jgi:membrane protease YdiL (CAAX protease family)
MRGGKALSEATETQTRAPRFRPTLREQRFEVSVFLFLIVPSMALTFFVVRRGNVSFVIAAVASILRDLGLVSLILFFLWHNDEPLGRIGWTWNRVREDVALGVLLFVPTFFGAGLLENALRVAGFSAPSTPLPSFLTAKGPWEIVLAAALVVVVAVAEETMFRGYLILRFQAVTKSSAAAVVLSGLIFAMGHGYEGTSGLVTVAALGTVFALVYLWRQSLVAPIVMHFLQDFLSIVLPPLLPMR